MVAGFQAYTWHGQTIENIEHWAAERGEKMIDYKVTRISPNLLTGKMSEFVEFGTMPETFWSALGYVALSAEGKKSYEKIGEREPGPKKLIQPDEPAE